MLRVGDDGQLYAEAGYRNPAGTEKVDWRPFTYGCIVGAFPWIAIGIVLSFRQVIRLMPEIKWVNSLQEGRIPPTQPRLLVPSPVDVLQQGHL